MCNGLAFRGGGRLDRHMRDDDAQGPAEPDHEGTAESGAGDGRPPVDERPDGADDVDLGADEFAALSSALDDAFEETFGGLDGPEAPEAGDPERDPLDTAADRISESSQALGGTDAILRGSRRMVAASREAMDGLDGRVRDAEPTREAPPQPAPDAPTQTGPDGLPDASPDAASDDAPDPAPSESDRLAAARATLLTERATETVDLEDADDDPVADLPSRPPDSLVGAIRWDEDAAPGPLRIAVAGGRGGAGRTLLVANTALVLARLGRRCTVVDLDPVGAGLHTALGLPPLLPGPAALLEPPPCEAEAIPGVPLHLMRPRRPMLTGPADPLRAECLAAAAERPDDVLLLDLGAQADPFTLDTWLDADVSVVVAEPLPAAIERAYGFLRAALWRRLLHGRGEPGQGPTAVARSVIAQNPEIDNPSRLIEALAAVDADAARAIRARVLTFTPRLLMNRTRSRVDREMGPAMVSALRRRWGVTAEFVGAIDFDEAVREAARRRRPLLLAYPGAGYSQAIEKVARTLDRLAEAGGAR